MEAHPRRLGVVAGKKGEKHTVEVVIGFTNFKTEIMLATDSSAKPGFGTRVHFGAWSIITAKFGNDGLSISHALQKHGEKISCEVEFLEDCTWSGDLFGKARWE